MPSLFIDGEWTSAASGAISQVVNPFDAAVVAEVDVADDADVQRTIAAARPVLTVELFSTEDEAVGTGNDTDYCLAGAVWTGEAGRAQRVAGRLRHGTVWINDYHPYLPQAEWEGFKHSGVGRELGPTRLGEYREAKHIYQNTAQAPGRWSRLTRAQRNC